VSFSILPTSKAEADVLRERERQFYDEGWSHDHDDLHVGGQLAIAAACYLMPVCYVHVALGSIPMNDAAWQAMEPPEMWPWDRGWYKPKNKRRDLVRAAALIIAEIERMDRAEAQRVEGAA
jgi:hypothetical protein